MTYEDYQCLIEGGCHYFIQYPDGQTKRQEDCQLTLYPHILCGSFNPLHKGHRSIFDDIHIQSEKFFEISVANADKATISFEDLNKRLSAFSWYAPIIVTNKSLFIQKAGIFKGLLPTFHVGGDTMARMIRDYTPYGIQGIAANFIVHPRYIGDHIMGISSLFKGFIPTNIKEGPARNDDLMRVSSTKIRSNL